MFDKYLDGWMDGRKDGRMDERTDEGRDDGLMDRWMDRRLGGLNDGMDGSSPEVKLGVGLLRDWITQVPLPQ